MFDSQGVRHLAETIEAVRATAREQVEFNSDSVSRQSIRIPSGADHRSAASHRFLQEPSTRNVTVVPGNQGEG